MQAMTHTAEESMHKLDVAQGSTQPKWSQSERMKAVVYQGTSMMGGKRVAFEDKPRPLLTHEKDVIVQVELSSISGCDLNVISGDLPAAGKGLILGHEAVGLVREVGSAVMQFKRGDRVVVPLNIVCGECHYCKLKQFSECDRTNDSTLFHEMYGGGRGPAAIFGFSSLVGGVPGCQADFVRVPLADVNLRHVPRGVSNEEAIFASDILASGLHGAYLGCVRKGDTVAVWGLGPVGLAAGAWCLLKGAERVIGIDRVPERLALARGKFGFETIDRSDMTSQQLIEHMMEKLPLAMSSAGGVDVAIDAVGFRHTQSFKQKMEKAVGMQTDTAEMMIEMAACTRKFGRIAAIGDYVGTTNHFPVGHIVQKHLSVRAGFVPVHKYFDEVFEALKQKKIPVADMVTHRLSLQDAALAYEKLYNYRDGYVKVMLQNVMP